MQTICCILRDARTRFLEELGYPCARIEQAGYMSPVVSFEVRYGEPLRYGTLPSYVLGSEGISWHQTTYSYEVFKQG